MPADFDVHGDLLSYSPLGCLLVDDGDILSCNDDAVATMGIPLRAGRTFEHRDTAASEPVMVINATLARQIWPGESAVDKELIVYFNGRHRRRVVGVVGDVDYGRDMTVGTLPDVQFYLPYGELATSTISIVIGSSSPPAVAAPAIRQALRASAPCGWRQPCRRLGPTACAVSLPRKCLCAGATRGGSAA